MTTAPNRIDDDLHVLLILRVRKIQCLLRIDRLMGLCPSLRRCLHEPVHHARDVVNHRVLDCPANGLIATCVPSRAVAFEECDEQFRELARNLAALHHSSDGVLLAQSFDAFGWEVLLDQGLHAVDCHQCHHLALVFICDA